LPHWFLLDADWRLPPRPKRQKKNGARPSADLPLMKEDQSSRPQMMDMSSQVVGEGDVWLIKVKPDKLCMDSGLDRSE